MLCKIVYFLCGIGIGILSMAPIFISYYFQSLPDMSPGIQGSFIGVCMCVGVVFVLKGKAKMFTLGLNTFWFVLSLIFVVFGIIGSLIEQFHEFRFLGFTTGLPGIFFFGFGYWIILKIARNAELRKSMSEDLTFSRNKEDKETSDE